MVFLRVNKFKCTPELFNQKRILLNETLWERIEWPFFWRMAWEIQVKPSDGWEWSKFAFLLLEYFSNSDNRVPNRKPNRSDRISLNLIGTPLLRGDQMFSIIPRKNYWWFFLNGTKSCLIITPPAHFVRFNLPNVFFWRNNGEYKKFPLLFYCRVEKK